MTFSKPGEHSRPIFKILNMLKIYDLEVEIPLSTFTNGF